MWSDETRNRQLCEEEEEIEESLTHLRDWTNAYGEETIEEQLDEDMHAEDVPEDNTGQEATPRGTSYEDTLILTFVVP